MTSKTFTIVSLFVLMGISLLVGNKVNNNRKKKKFPQTISFVFIATDERYPLMKDRNVSTHCRACVRSRVTRARKPRRTEPHILGNFLVHCTDRRAGMHANELRLFEGMSNVVHFVCKTAHRALNDANRRARYHARSSKRN